MRTWPVQDAKARFSEMLDTCVGMGRRWSRGADAAVLVRLRD